MRLKFKAISDSLLSKPEKKHLKEEDHKCNKRIDELETKLKMSHEACKHLLHTQLKDLKSEYNDRIEEQARLMHAFT